MGPITPVDSGTTTRTSAVAAVRGVPAVAAVAADTTGRGREGGTVNLSARATEVAARETRERQNRETGDATLDREIAAAADAMVRTVTYSFYERSTAGSADPQAQQARSVADRQRVREALSYYASVAEVQFVEVGSGGDVQYGVTPAPSPAALRAAEARAEADVAQSRAETKAAEASAAEAAAAEQGASDASASAQTDDLVGLNPDDPDGAGGRTTRG